MLQFLLTQVLAFDVGEGSQFVMSTQGQKVDLNIYIAKKSEHKMSVEFHFGTGGLLPTSMWQQFEMELKGKSPIKITQGFIQTQPDTKPEKMPQGFFGVNQGVQLQDFLFNSKEMIDGDFIGDEQVEVIAGHVIAKHYRKKRDGQTVDFWISDEVKPIGLVKLTSKSTKKQSNNYEIELASLLKNVKPTIDSKQAIQMTSETKKILGKPKK